MNTSCLIAVAITGVTCALATPAAFGATSLTYTVDPARSALIISGTYAGHSMEAQSFVGSLAASYLGTITADRDFLADTLRITGGEITAQNNGSHTVSAGTAANYGFYVRNGDGLQVTKDDLSANVLNFSFSPISSLISPTVGFDVSQLVLAVTSGEVEYAFVNPGTTSGFGPLGGGLALGADLGSLVDTANVETLTLPISADLSLEINGSPLLMHLSGAIVATAPVPEPGSLGILALPAVILSTRRRAARRAQ